MLVYVLREWRAGLGGDGPEPFQILLQERGEKGLGCTVRLCAKQMCFSLGGCAGDVISGFAHAESVAAAFGSPWPPGRWHLELETPALLFLLRCGCQLTRRRAPVLGRGAPPPLSCLCLLKVLLHLLFPSPLLVLGGPLSALLELSFLVGKSISVCFRLCTFARRSRDQSQACPSPRQRRWGPW